MMYKIKTLPWASPLDYAAALSPDEKTWVLLYSGERTSYSGTTSILALRPSKLISSSQFDKLAASLTGDKSPYENAWFGYLGYGLKHQLEVLPDDEVGNLNVPDIWMGQFDLLLVFHHDKQVIDVWATSESLLEYVPTPHTLREDMKVSTGPLQSNMTKNEYLQKVKTIKEAIINGDLCQANLTRKFYGTFQSDISAFALFHKLVQLSPSTYSVYLQHDDVAVLSSSPERFLHIDSQGQVSTKPIKGSAPRYADEKSDQVSFDTLKNSEKDRAENLMIVDLSRHDLSKHCEFGSVKVDKLYDIHSYKTVHHMVSTVIGKKRDDVSSLELVKGCFPPGSMTGTPKIKAMELCTELERQERGIYAGAIGWFGGDGSVDLSVVIRTLIIQGKQFEFQVGGAIVADSTPEGEWEETLVKAKAIAATLGIEQETLMVM